jgi:peptidoglycan/xylan/chitin deacetylase (PgdA/CDA1 family)
MTISLKRQLPLLASILASFAFGTPAVAGECAGNPNAIGTSRTIVVDPRAHGRIGTMSYPETLPLRDKEVVLTFDDGPLPPYTSKILDILKSECIHATFFIVGSMAKAYPALVRRAYEEGHTIGTHSMSHPLAFRKLTEEQAKAQIEDGIAATTAALGDPSHLAPFFRFPGFGRTNAADAYLASRGIMAWGADEPADDWKKISSDEIARRAMRRLESKGGGVLLLHDIHARTLAALPTILKELKARGFHIVHVVPAHADRPATVTADADWLPRWRRRYVQPVIPIAAVLDPDGLVLTKKSADALCMLTLTPRVKQATTESKRKPAARTKAAATTPDRPQAHGKAHSHEPPINVAGHRHHRRPHVERIPAQALGKRAMQ